MHKFAIKISDSIKGAGNNDHKKRADKIDILCFSFDGHVQLQL